MNRRDLFGECNVDGTPIDVFSAECCVRCINPECTRSAKGGKFELRVSTWEDRLFRNPPRMDPKDPRLAQIAGQKFLMIDSGRVPEIGGSGWDTHPEPLQEAVKMPLPAPPLSLPDPPLLPPAPTPPRRLVLANAPDQTGKTVGRSPPPAPDPWAAPPPEDRSGPIISPGATVKFGRGGV